MKILHFAPLNFKKSTGFTFSVPNLVRNQDSYDGIKSKLINTENKIVNYNLEKKTKKNIKYFRFKNYDFNLIKKSKPDIIIFHSLYEYKHVKISKKVKKIGIPYIIVPRSSMTNKAQKQKRLKKWIGNLLFFNKFIKNASAIHYLSKGEKNNSQKWNVDSFVVGNGMNLPKEKLLKKKKKKKEKLNFTFIGRKDINHKGLDLLIEGINLISDFLKNKNVKFDLYGPDYEGGNKVIKNLISKYNLKEIVKNYSGVYSKEKKRVLLESDIFVHTSRFEGHPMSILEAMAYKIPCLVTPGTNMAEEIEKNKCGWTTNNNKKSIANKIKEIIKNKYKLDKYSENARNLIKENYTWAVIAKKSLNEYKKII